MPESILSGERRIWIVRHGQTYWNLEGRQQGRKDSPLTEAGLNQSKRIGEFLKKYPIDVIYTSTLGRAIATARIIASYHNFEPVIRPELDEMCFGIWEGLTKDEIKQKYGDMEANRKANKYKFRIPGGESYFDVEQRAEQFTRDLEKTEYDEICIVGHESVNRVVTGLLTDLETEKWLEIRQPNDKIYIILKNSNSSIYETYNLEGR